MKIRVREELLLFGGFFNFSLWETHGLRMRHGTSEFSKKWGGSRNPNNHL